MASHPGHADDSLPTIYLHIGTPKSGTTYLQSRFAENHERAAAQGLFWPGPSWGRHVAAARELRKLAPGEEPARRGPWSRLAEDALAWNGRAVLISMEWLSSLQPHQIEAALASLEPARVEVVCTARDLVRSFVAQGQEMAKNYRTWPWSQLATEVLEDTGGPAHQTFWRQQDLPQILGAWLKFVPGDRVHLVTVPPAGADPEVLWHRFCDVLGVDGTGFTVPESDNASLGVVSTTLMQRLNTVAAARGLDHPVYKRAVHKTIGVDILGPRRKQEEPIGLSEELDHFLRERSDRMVAELRELGVDLHGDWADLVPGPPAKGRRPETVTDSELLEVAMEALVTLAVRHTEELEKARPQQRAGIGDQRRRAVRAARRVIARAKRRR